MSKFFGYLSDDERDVLALENSFDLEVRRLSVQLDVVCEATAINMAEAENKVIMESGTTEDLDTLYEAAVDEGAEKSKGLLGKLFDAIKKFIATVKSKVTSIFTKEKAESLKAEKEVTDIGVLDTVNGKLNGFMSEAKSKFAKLVHGAKLDDSEIEELKAKAKKIGIVVGAATGATVVGKVLYDKIIKGSKEIDGAENATNALQELYHSAKDGADSKKMKDILASVSEAIKNSSSALFKTISESKVGKLASGVGEKVKEKMGKKEGEEKTVKESANDFDALLENYSHITESGEDDLDGTVVGSFEDLEKALEIF